MDKYIYIGVFLNRLVSLLGCLICEFLIIQKYPSIFIVFLFLLNVLSMIVAITEISSNNSRKYNRLKKTLCNLKTKKQKCVYLLTLSSFIIFIKIILPIVIAY